MIIKNVKVSNVEPFINGLLIDLLKNNINHLHINYGNYHEIHMGDYIYRIVDDNIIFKNCEIIYIDKDIYSDIVDEFISDSSKKDKKPTYNFEFNKERPGFKRYTKNDIRKGNQNSKPVLMVKKKFPR